MKGDLREQMRMHKLTMNRGADETAIREHYNTLPEDDKGKDIWPFNSMLELLKKYDGVRIYKLKIHEEKKKNQENQDGSAEK